MRRASIRCVYAPQIWSPIAEISISALQFEHLMVGRLLCPYLPAMIIEDTELQLLSFHGRRSVS
jgi:hypothetical protein